MTWPEDLTREQPRSSRPPAAESLQKAVLKIASTKWSVMLLEDATDDLSVLLEGSPTFWLDDVGELQTTIGWFEVRVASIVRVGSESEVAGSKRVKFRVGLRRLREVASSDGKSGGSGVARVLRGLLASLFPAERSNVFSGIALALLLITTPVVLAALAWNHNSPMTIQATRWAKTFFGANGSAEETKPAADVDLRDAVQQLPGVEAFLLPKVADELKLTQEQLAALGRLNVATRQASRDFDQYWRNDSQAEHARKRAMILDTARQEALRLLTDQQRERWKGLGQ